MKTFAVLQLSSCAGCEVALLNADEWVDQYNLAYMPLVTSTHNLPPVDLLFVSGSVRTDDDLHNLRKAVKLAGQVVAVGTCAISGGVAHLGDRDDIRTLFLAQAQRRHVPRLLPKSHPVDEWVNIDLYLPGCPPTPELFMAALTDQAGFKEASSVCQECGRVKDREIRPTHLSGFQKGEVDPQLCLVNQGYLCIGASTRAGCRALCTRPGHPCVGCRGPSNAFIEKESSAWLASILRVFTNMTDIPVEELEEALRSPQLAMFLFQFSDYDEIHHKPRPREKVL
jgi:F420-non-reducing hydrogenase small subunit